MIIALLSLALVECQSQQVTPPVSEEHPPAITQNQEPETLSPHPLSGLPREQIYLTNDSGNSIKILAEIADEPEAQERGLMFRESLPQGEGMVFVFPEEIPLGFWMKNTLIPLDILFFDASRAWVSGTTMTPCEADPCPGYSAESAAKYALEVPVGFIEKQGVGMGWFMQLPLLGISPNSSQSEQP